MTATKVESMDIKLFGYLMFVVTRFTLSNISGYLRNAVYKFIARMEPKVWHNDLSVVKSLLYSYGKMGLVSEKFIYNVNKVCEAYENGYIKDKEVAVRVSMCVLNLRIKTSD